MEASDSSNLAEAAEVEGAELPLRLTRSGVTLWTKTRLKTLSSPKMFENLKNNDKALVRTILALALCHDIIIDEKKGVYNAASPDELALVNAAKQFGYEFAGCNADDVMTIKTPKGD